MAAAAEAPGATSAVCNAAQLCVGPKACARAQLSEDTGRFRPWCVTAVAAVRAVSSAAADLYWAVGQPDSISMKHA